MLERATHKLFTRSFLAVRNYHKIMLFDSQLEALLVHLNIRILFVLKHLYELALFRQDYRSRHFILKVD